MHKVRLDSMSSNQPLNVVFVMVSKLLLGDAEVVVQFRTMTETSSSTARCQAL
jgi:hypothetical protein